MASDDVRKEDGNQQAGGVQAEGEAGEQEVAPALTPEIVEPEEHGNLPSFEGRQMRPEHLEAFHLAFVEKKSNKDIAALLGFNPTTISQWRKTGWWALLHDWWVSEKQEAFEAALLDKDENLLQAVDDIITGKRAEDRSVNTIGKILDVRMKMGKDPHIQQKSAVQITNQTINNKGTINIEKAKEHLTHEEMLEMVTTGRIPDKVRGE